LLSVPNNAVGVANTIQTNRILFGTKTSSGVVTPTTTTTTTTP